MFMPVVLSDRRAATAGVDRLKWWLGQFFLTNIFFIPFMALRGRAPAAAALALPASSPTDAPSSASAAASPPPPPPPLPRSRLLRTAVGGVGATMSAVCVAWAVAARPEFGGLDARAEHFMHLLYTDRVYFAFVMDMVLYR